MQQNKRKGFTVIAIDNDFMMELNNFKKSIEDNLGRQVSYPFVTNLLLNVFPKKIKVSKVWVNDKHRRNRTVQFMVEYLMEEI